MPLVQIVCLANSRKHQGRCIAGIAVKDGGWVRPVGSSVDGALFFDDYRLQDGTEPQILDLLEIELTEPRPEPHQPENWLIGRRGWRLLARPVAKDAATLLRARLDGGPDLLGNSSDRISFADFAVAPATASLTLTAPKEVQWNVTVRGNRRHHRASFSLGGTHYDLAITDPVWEQRLSVLAPGIHSPESIGLLPDDRLLLTVSLGEPFSVDNCCYKLVAGIVVVPPAWRRR